MGAESAIAVRDELFAAIDTELVRLADVFDNDLAAFKLLATGAGLEAVRVATL